MLQRMNTLPQYGQRRWSMSSWLTTSIASCHGICNLWTRLGTLQLTKARTHLCSPHSARYCAFPAASFICCCPYSGHYLMQKLGRWSFLQLGRSLAMSLYAVIILLSLCNRDVRSFRWFRRFNRRATQLPSYIRNLECVN